ncbi:MAG: hypothetical protein LBI55_01110 [Oscillospiraceae bacterium]|jgi:vacuolar-type H+-ATPase subunit E/Vma4|nr:hypothetical protein [Oscillospiraceae bacterium]
MLNKVEKTNNFLNAINKYAEEQRTKIRGEGKDFKEKELEKAEREALREAYLLIQKEMATVKSEVESDISKEELASRGKISQEKERICKEIFEFSKKTLIKFTKSNQYPVMVENSVRKIFEFGVQDATFYIRSEDSNLSQNIKAVFPGECKIVLANEIEIGGIKAFSHKSNFFIDETLDKKLQSQEKWFAANCGISLI